MKSWWNRLEKGQPALKIITARIREPLLAKDSNQIDPGHEACPLQVAATL